MEKTAHAIVENLLSFGIDHVFGVPGGITINLINEFYGVRDKIKVILTRNEQTASIMANTYGRLTGKPGVFIAQGPYAASIGLLGAIESYTGSAPMLILTDITDYGVFASHYPAQSGSGEPGTFDLRNILKATCKYVAAPKTPEDAVQAVQQGLKHAISGRPGPSAVIFRSSNFSQFLRPEVYPKIYPITSYTTSRKPQADPHAIEEALELIRNAKSPLVIAGNGIHVSKAYSLLRSFSELTSTPVATSNMGRGTVDEEHHLSVGCVGAFGHPLANAVAKDSDLLLILGCRLKPQDTCYENPKIIDGNRQKIIHVDCEPENIGSNLPVNLGIVGDLNLVLQQFLAGAERVDWVDKRERVKEIASRKVAMNHLNDATLRSDNRPILPQRVVSDIRQNIPKDTLVFTDAGNNRFWMGRYFPAREASYFGPGGTLSMSYAAPAAVVAKMLFPGRPCLAVAGDGGFMMEAHVLSTAIQYGTPVVFIIFNNSCLGMVTENQAGNLIGSCFAETNFAGIAKGFGIEGKRIEHAEELPESIHNAFASGKPYLLDVVVSNDEKIYRELFAPEAREVFTLLTTQGLFFPKV